MLLVRARAPLWPLPDVLPRPEPMPRPSRLRLVRAPGLSRSSFSFIGGYSFTLDRLDDEQVLDLVDPPAHRPACPP